MSKKYLAKYMRYSEVKCARFKLQCAPSWLLEKAMHEEVEQHWVDAVYLVNEDNLDKKANIISSYVMHKFTLRRAPSV